MQWTADTIFLLRKTAGLTQAQLADWLGVTVKQVKHLEHQRRNPSGPVTRLLDVLQARLNDTHLARENDLVQMVGSSKRGTPPARRAAAEQRRSERPMPEAETTSSPPEDSPSQTPEDGAFVWS